MPGFLLHAGCQVLCTHGGQATPTVPNPGYGFCNWYLNTGRKLYPAAREDSLSYNGDGANIVFVDYQHDIVAVVRWIDGNKMKEFVRLLIEATGEPAT